MQNNLEPRPLAIERFSAGETGAVGSQKYSCVIHERSADSELTDAPLRPSGRSMGQDQGYFCLPVKAMSASPPRITGYSLRRYFTVITQAYLGATCRNVLATRSRFIRGFRAGRRVAHGRRSSKCWRPMRTTNTR